MKKRIFSSMSKEQKRMAVLRDALKLIRKEMVVISPQIVFQFARSSYEHNDIVRELSDNLQLQEILIQHFKKGKKCQVCERGLLLVATVLLDNKFKIGQIETGGCYCEESTTDKRLRQFFSGEQLKLMEDTFLLSEEEIGSSEQNQDYYEDAIGQEVYDEKFYFFLTYPEDTERAAAILENAIANKGIFKP